MEPPPAADEDERSAGASVLGTPPSPSPARMPESEHDGGFDNYDRYRFAAGHRELPIRG
jgi:hypothetical protein